MNIILRLFLMSLMPIGMSFLIALVNWKTKFVNLKPGLKQVIIGIIFGIVSILGTYFGVKTTNGAVINVRDVAPMCAGFIFGGWSGIIAGIIGGLYRFVAVYFDGATILGAAGSYTQIACTVSTICAGIFTALIRKYIFDNHHGKWYYGLPLGVLCESFHMLMVFVSHSGDIENAYLAVKNCALPMIIVNSLAVAIALIGVALIYKEKMVEIKKPMKLSSLVQYSLIGSLVLAFALISVMTYRSLENTSDVSTSTLLKTSCEDVKKDVDQAVDRGILEVLEECSNDINEYLLNTSLSSQDINTKLNDLATVYGITEYSLISAHNIIYSNNAKVIDFDMLSGEQSKEFSMYLIDNLDRYYIQDYQAITQDTNKYMKYGAIRVDENIYNIDYLQIGYNQNTYQKFLLNQIQYSCVNSHIGNSGYIIVTSNNGIVLSTLDGIDINKVYFINKLTLESKTIGNFNDEEVYYYAVNINGFYIIAVQSVYEADLDTNISLMISQLSELFIFMILYFYIYILMKKFVLNSIDNIGKSLRKISDGDLDVHVNERKTNEFNHLSDNINKTVDTLEDLIEKEANRLNEELEFAKTIQISSLPTNYKLDGKDNIDLYATMRTAKEVGGDFYDFYKLDDDRIAILIADVSGKGIPAALFMMKAKAIIKSLASSGIPVNEVFNKANALLNEGNDANMFVTSWLGFVNTKTGVVEYVNGGHNPILVKHNNKYEYLRSKPGFILAVMEGMKYTYNSIQLDDNDSLYLYTDGVTEATSLSKELYGEDRLVNTLNTLIDKSSIDVCKAVFKSIDKFVGKAEQSDDITMLALKYKKKDIYEHVR